MGTDGARGLLFCVAKRSGAFPPNMPAGLRARVSRHALFAGQHGVPELGQEQVDVIGERLQLKPFAAFEEAALVW